MKYLNQILGTKYPIIQGGMANIATGAFAAACSNAGGLGLIGAGGIRDAESLRSEIQTCRQATDESGGHVGEMTTMTLVPQICDTVKIPVIAAGGIADKRQMKAALDLGACGVQVGTCLLVSTECPIHENYKSALLKAKGSDTVVTGRSIQAPVRIIKNKMAREYIKKERAGADKMELEQYTLGSLRRAVFDGDIQTGSLMSGQTCGQLSAIRPLSEIFASLCEGLSF